jgi:hypothetical protein
MVTKENKKQFEKWFNNQVNNQTDYNKFLPSHCELFNTYPFEMKIGVYLAYYDHKEILINVTSFTRCVIIAMSYERSCYFIGNVNHNITSKKRTRNEAYKAAFKKADELINKNKDE